MINKTTQFPQIPPTETRQGSIQYILEQNIGTRVITESLVGTETFVKKEGLVYSVGLSYVVLYEPNTNLYTLIDLYSIRFITFFPEEFNDAKPAK